MSIELQVLTFKKSSSQFSLIKFLKKVRTQTKIPKGRSDLMERSYETFGNC